MYERTKQWKSYYIWAKSIFEQGREQNRSTIFILTTFFLLFLVNMTSFPFLFPFASPSNHQFQSTLYVLRDSTRSCLSSKLSTPQQFAIPNLRIILLKAFLKWLILEQNILQSKASETTSKWEALQNYRTMTQSWQTPSHSRGIFLPIPHTTKY